MEGSSSSSSYGEGGRIVSTFGMQGLAMAELKLRFFMSRERESERERGGESKRWNVGTVLSVRFC